MFIKIIKFDQICMMTFANHLHLVEPFVDALFETSSLHCDPYRHCCLLAVFHSARSLITVLGQISMEDSRVSQLYYRLVLEIISHMQVSAKHVDFAAVSRRSAKVHFAWQVQYKRHLHQRCWEVRALIS